MSQAVRSSLPIGLALFAGVVMAVAIVASSVKADPPPAYTDIKPGPVEKDMHEFMEHMFEPTFKRLKKSMATEPAERATWKAIASDALILAEGSNQLMVRSPERGEASWAKPSALVRKLGGELYMAARRKDAGKAKAAYGAMVEQCNACHRAHADGKHILKP